MRKTIIPTTRSPPTTKCPKASMTLPAEAWRRMRRVEETLRASLYRVATSSSEGKTEKSRGLATYIATSRIDSARAMLRVSRTSSMAGGRGMSIIPTSRMMPAASITSLWRSTCARSPWLSSISQPPARTVGVQPRHCIPATFMPPPGGFTGAIRGICVPLRGEL